MSSDDSFTWAETVPADDSDSDDTLNGQTQNGHSDMILEEKGTRKLSEAIEESNPKTKRCKKRKHNAETDSEDNHSQKKKKVKADDNSDENNKKGGLRQKIVFEESCKEDYLNLKVKSEELSTSSSSKSKKKKRKKHEDSVSMNESESFDENHLKSLVKQEISSDLEPHNNSKKLKKSKKNKKRESDLENGHDEFDEKFLATKVEAEFNFATPVKLKKNIKHNVSSDFESQRDKTNEDLECLSSAEETNSEPALSSKNRKRSSNSISKRTLHRISENDSTDESQGKSKSPQNQRNSISKSTVSTNNTSGEDSSDEDQSKSTSPKKQLNKKKSKSKISKDSSSEDEVSDKDQSKSKSHTKQSLNNSKYSSDDDTTRNEPVQSKKISAQRITDRITFEQDDSNMTEKLDKSSSRLKKFLQANSKLHPINNIPKGDSIIKDDDEVWILKCPHDINITTLTDSEFVLDKKCKFKMNGETYHGTIESDVEKIAVTSFEKKGYLIKHIPLSGVVHVKKRIPKQHLQDDSTLMQSHNKFIPLPETKVRHPFFGADYKKAMKVPKRIIQQLKSEIEETTFEENVRERKKSKKRMRESLKEETLEVDVPEQETVPEKRKKSKKRKHDDSDEIPAKKSKQKKLNETGDVWDSEKAIEENLFNY